MKRVALVNLSSLRMPGNDPIFPLGIERIRQVLEDQGHSVRVIDFAAHPELQHDHRWIREGWDVIGLTIRNIDPIDLACESHVPHYMAYALELREAAGTAAQDIVWVGGGPGFSLFAQELTHALELNVGVIGPGESLMAGVCADTDRYLRVSRIVTTGAPDPEFSCRIMHYDPSLMSVYASRPGAMIGVETRRKSCYQGCTYCPYAHITKNDLGSSRDIEALMVEIREIYNSGIHRVFFTDGIFNAELAFAKKVVRALNALDLPGFKWSAYFTPKPFDDEFARLLSQSAVEYVVISPDSLHSGMMNELGKSFDVRHVDRCLDLCRHYDLEPRVNVVLGGPNETEETLRATVEYINDNLEPHELALHIGYRVLPQTAMSRQTGATSEELLEPTFLYIDPDMFSWIYEYLDRRFLTTELILNMAAAKRSLKFRKIVTPKFSVARKKIPLSVV